MSRKRKCLIVLALLLPAVVLMGCGSWDELFGQESPAPRSTVPEGVKTVGSDSALVGTPIKLHAVPGRGSAEPWPPASLRWTVEPSDGAVVSPGGNFKASKPGVYRVTATLTNGSNENDHIFITVTSPESAFEGTYQGTIAASSNLADAQVPWEFTVGADGKLKGGYRYALTSQVKMAVTFTGVVAEDGGVAARGTGTGSGVANGKRTSVSSAISLTGKISGTTFSGSFAGGKGSKGLTVTAERQ